MLTEYLVQVAQGDETAERLRWMLMNQRELLKDKIGEMQKVLGILDHKIAVYDENLLRIEQDLTDKEMEFEK